jgi:hypothetical protein
VVVGFPAWSQLRQSKKLVPSENLLYQSTVATLKNVQRNHASGQQDHVGKGKQRNGSKVFRSHQKLVPSRKYQEAGEFGEIPPEGKRANA